MVIQEKAPQDNLDYFEDLTGEIAETKQEKTVAIGDRIRSLRESKDVSLDSLSNMTGFDVDLLASIEKKDVQPQLGTVIKLSKALDGAFGRVVSGEGDKLYSVSRRGDRTAVQRSTGKKGKQQLYSYNILTPEVKGRNMETFMVTLEENPTGETSVHEGEEFIYVLEGSVRAQIGDDTIDLEPGDSIYYLSTTPHLVAAQSGTANILAVIYEG